MKIVLLILLLLLTGCDDRNVRVSDEPVVHVRVSQTPVASDWSIGK